MAQSRLRVPVFRILLSLGLHLFGGCVGFILSRTSFRFPVSQMSEEQSEISNQPAEAKPQPQIETTGANANGQESAKEVEAAASPTEASTTGDPTQTDVTSETTDADSATTDVKTSEEKPKAKQKKAPPPPDTPEQREANKQSLEEVIARMQELAKTADKLKTAERWLTKADQRLSELGPLPQAGKVALMKSFSEARRELFIRTGELREADEWKRWANVPKQEALIKRVEELGASENRKGLAKKLKAAQAEWKEVGPAPRDKAQELWNRFKAACDRAYVTVKAERVEQQAEQKVNLEKKLELCKLAEEMAQTDDWAKGAAGLKKLQGDWKSIGPVPRRQSDKIWKRFRTACDSFFEKRRPHLERSIAEQEGNLAAKMEICERIEALAKSDTELEEAIRKVSNYRRDWRDIGHVPAREFKGLSDRFKKACDEVYGKKDKLREEKSAKLKERFGEISSMINSLLSGEKEVAEGENSLGALCGEVRGLSREAEADDEIRKGTDALIKSVVDGKPEALAGTDLDPETSRKRKEKLIQRLNGFVDERTKDENAGKPTSAEDMAAKLRAALADRALGGVLSKSAKLPAKDLVSEVKASWSRLGPVTEPMNTEMEKNFRELCKRALSLDS